MDELIHEITKRTGLPEDKARAAAETVIGFLQDKLPEPAKGMLSQYVTGGKTPDLVGQASKAVGGLFKSS